MRAHGALHVSDPTIMHDGHISLGTQRIDLNSPVFIAAAAACRGKLSGRDAGNFLLEALAPRKVTGSTSRLAAASADALEVPLATIGKQRAADFLCCLEPR
jgi:hypothetical protein